MINNFENSNVFVTSSVESFQFSQSQSNKVLVYNLSRDQHRKTNRINSGQKKDKSISHDVLLSNPILVKIVKTGSREGGESKFFRKKFLFFFFFESIKRFRRVNA